MKTDTKDTLPVLLPEDFKGHWKENVKESDYHGDKTFVSSSGARLALKSQRAFYRGFVMGKAKEETDAMRFGTAAHLAILEPDQFKKRFVVVKDFGDMRSSINRAKKDEWKMGFAGDTVFMEQEDLDRLNWMIESLLGCPTAVNMLKDGVREATGYARDPKTGIGIRIKPDFLRHDLSVMPDLKTCRESNYEGFLSAIKRHRYDMQLVHYDRGVFGIHGRGCEDLCWIASQNVEPFETQVWVMTPGMRELATRHLDRSFARIQEGLKEGAWKGSQTQAEPIDFPSYWYEREIYEEGV